MIHGIVLAQCSRSYSIITSLLKPNYVINCLDFSNDCFDTAVVTVQGRFTREIPKSEIPFCGTLWKTSSET